MKRKLIVGLWALGVVLGLLNPQRIFGTACVSARFNDWQDFGCNQAPGSKGGPAPGANNAGGNESACPTCPPANLAGEPNGLPDGEANGMPRWWVDEPYINLHLNDVPLSYVMSSGKRMDFRMLYKQRYMLPMPDQCPDLYYSPLEPYIPRNAADPYVFSMRTYGMTNADWGHNWMMDIVFWDSAWESYYATEGNNFENVYEDGYEALVFRPEGGIYDLTASSPSDPESQIGLQPISTLGYPVINNSPTYDANTNYWGTDPGVGFTLNYPDGSQDVFGLAFNDRFMSPGFGTPTTAHALLTQRIDPQSRVTHVGYESFAGVFRVKYVVDPDGLTNTFVYASGSAQTAWQMSAIEDPFGRQATFTYGTSGYTNGLLSSITDEAGLTSAFTYQGINGWITNLSTPYGDTEFSYYQVSDPTVSNGFEQRATYVAEPEGAQQLFCYIHQATNGVPGSTNSPSVPNQVFDNGSGTNAGTVHFALSYRDTFHWDRLQFQALADNYYAFFWLTNTSDPDLATAIGYLTAADYTKAHLKHWLLGEDEVSVTEAISSERDPSTDAEGLNPGAWTWYNYTNKYMGYKEVLGSSAQIDCMAQLLPDGTSQYTVYNYYSGSAPLSGLVANSQATYSETNGTVGVLNSWFQYAGNYIDLINASDSAGQAVNLAYNTNHQVTSITNALNQTESFIWDSGTKNLTGITNFNGQSISISYSGMPSSIVVEPEGLTIGLVNYTNNLPQTIHVSGTGVPDLWLTNAWDNLNRLIGTTFQDNTAVSNIYTFLDLSAHKDRLGNWTYFGHDALQHLTSITNALTYVTQFGWCDCGSLKSITDALTNYTSLNYDNQGKLTNVVFPDSASLTYQFDLNGRMTGVVDGLGNGVQLTHNNQGLVNTVSNVFGALWQVQYDAVNRPTIITNAENVVVTDSYDLINRLVTRAWPDGTNEGFGYATNGLIAYTNRDSDITRWGRDAAGRVTSVTNGYQSASQRVIGLGYDARDHVTSLTDGLSHSTTWRYNQWGWLTNKLDALGNPAQVFTYDPDGRVTNRWTPVTTNTTYSYDAVGNLQGISYPGATNPTAPISFSYDAVNRRTNMVDGIGTTVFGYTESGQLASELNPFSTLHDTITYLYSQGHRTNLTLTQPSGTWGQAYVYDSAWRLQNLVSSAGSFGYGYQASASALVQNLALPNGANITNQYDSLARLSSTALVNHWGHILDGDVYGYDGLGLRTSITRNFGLGSNSVAAAYDALGQLTSWTAKEASGTPRLNEQLGYGYDAGGNLNLRTNGALVQTFGVNSLNELTSVSRTGTLTVSGATPAPATNVTVNGLTAQTNADFTFAVTNNTLVNGNNSFTNIAKNVYGVTATSILTVNLPTSVSLAFDGNGNLTSDGTRSFFYDGENQLTNVNVANAWKTEFAYDGLGRRRIERDYAWVSSTWSKTNETRFICDGMLPIQERDTNNNPLVTYTCGLDLSLSLQGAGGIGGLLARTDTNGSTYYHADGLGNITALMDGNENIVARYEYDAFGKPIGMWGTMAPVNRIRYSSFLTVQGIVLSYARPYFPELQRWGSRDPIGEYGGINLYGFVGNSPLNAVDPYGLLATAPLPVSIGGEEAVGTALEEAAAVAGAGDIAAAALTVPAAIGTGVLMYNGLFMNPQDDPYMNPGGINAPPDTSASAPLPQGWTGTDGQYQDQDGNTRNADGSIARDKNGNELNKDKKPCPEKRKSSKALRKQWENENNKPWPIDPKTGQNQDVSHKVPVADGGDPNDVNNYGPQPHDEHIQMHQDNGDFQRWGGRNNP